MKKENYITIQGWMVSELKLSGNELICYALIYGFTQDEESEFKGSLSYIAEWLNVSKCNARLILNRLVDKGHLVKRDELINNVRFCRYKASLNGMIKTAMGVADSATGGVADSATNNTIVDNIEDKKEDTNVSKKEDISSKRKTNKPDDLYLIHDVVLDKLKIGRSNNPKSRLKQLQIVTSNKLDLLFIIKGKGYLEAQIHSFFNSINTNSEWFDNDGQIIKYFKEELL